ncbi:MAG: hypothetical protein OXE17_04665 [Chloroflexi bacterium]|nr:hypothetical protein [Chloroflexota bacterium]
MPNWIEELPDGTRRLHVTRDSLEAASMLDYEGAPELTDEQFAELAEAMREVDQESEGEEDPEGA